MPRKKGYPSMRLPVIDATNQDILDAIGNKSLEDVVDSLEEMKEELDTIRLGHELYLWEQEVV